MGLEIVEETPRTCTVKDLIDSSDFSMLKAIRRMHLIAKEMVKESPGITESSLDSFRSSDVEIDKIYWMIARQHSMVLCDIFFAEKLGVTPQEAFCNLLVARSLEKIADRTLKIASNIIMVENRDFRAKVDGIIPDVLTIMDNSVRSYITTDFDLANEVVCMCSGLEARINRLNNDVLNEPSAPSQIAAYVIIIDCLGRIVSYIADVAETAMNHEYVKEKQSSTIVA
jgi:phosphate uptake regulator